MRTGSGGVFLFAADLASCDPDGILEQAGRPGSSMIPAGCAFRTLLALKLRGIGRPSQVMAETLDEGPALFAGLNAIPKRATLREYSSRADHRLGPELMHRWHAAVRSLGVDLGAGESFDLDFHTIPCHGDDALIQKHYVSRRSRRQRGVLAFPARVAGARFFAYAYANVRKKDQNDEILRFAQAWRTRTESFPGELVFGSRLTTYANLAKLDGLGIGFLSLRRRTPKLVAELLAEPAGAWRQITLASIGRINRKPRILDRRITLKHYPGEIRQITITDLGHEKRTLLITNQMDATASILVGRYALRMVIENTIADAIDFFHMDALSAAVPRKVQFDLQVTLMASTLYRILARRLGNGMEYARSDPLPNSAATSVSSRLAAFSPVSTGGSMPGRGRQGCGSSRCRFWRSATSLAALAGGCWNCPTVLTAIRRAKVPHGSRGRSAREFPTRGARPPRRNRRRPGHA